MEGVPKDRQESGLPAVVHSAWVHGTKKRNPIHPVMWNLMIVFCVVIYGSYTIMMHLCEVDHKMPFSSSSMVLMIECLKLLISVVAYIFEKAGKPDCWKFPPAQFVLPLAIPAILYCLNNNLCVHMQLQMDSASYQVLSNLKILTTAFVYRLALGRQLKWIQWFAIFLLAVGSACNSYGGIMKTGSPAVISHSVLHVSITGLLMIAVYSTVSAVSGVYTEYVLKYSYDTSLHLQNSVLYIFGIITNSFVWMISTMNSDQTSSSGSLNLFRGYTAYTWALVVTQACVGLIMSAVMKHASNITRLFIIACAMLVATFLSVMVFHFHLNFYFCCAFVFVMMALCLYHQS